MNIREQHEKSSDFFFFRQELEHRLNELNAERSSLIEQLEATKVSNASDGNSNEKTRKSRCDNEENVKIDEG